jgi:hypothetical protein
VFNHFIKNVYSLLRLCRPFSIMTNVGCRCWARSAAGLGMRDSVGMARSAVGRGSEGARGSITHAAPSTAWGRV